MRTVKASEFKARCLALMDEVARTGEPVLVTKRGRPVAELRPATGHGKRGLAAWKGQVRIVGDIVSPLDEPSEARE
ncbi:MAG: type II toxin-antitoxin system Phd/YefM family antitoxin [Steroidobacteraceae bacterium]|nr:type II toxin-antitoxin system Phd/YefM family antitoxin [Steroidobacteraceae bacterium]